MWWKQRENESSKYRQKQLKGKTTEPRQSAMQREDLEPGGEVWGGTPPPSPRLLPPEVSPRGTERATRALVAAVRPKVAFLGRQG